MKNGVRDMEAVYAEQRKDEEFTRAMQAFMKVCEETVKNYRVAANALGSSDGPCTPDLSPLRAALEKAERQIAEYEGK